MKENSFLYAHTPSTALDEAPTFPEVFYSRFVHWGHSIKTVAARVRTEVSKTTLTWFHDLRRRRPSKDPVESILEYTMQPFHAPRDMPGV